MVHRSAWHGIVLMTFIAMAMPALSDGSDCPAVTACFTPGENCTQTIVQVLGGAKRTVLAQAYSFTSAPIAKALLDAHKRGVQVPLCRLPGEPGRAGGHRCQPRHRA